MSAVNGYVVIVEGNEWMRVNSYQEEGQEEQEEQEREGSDAKKTTGRLSKIAKSLFRRQTRAGVVWEGKKSRWLWLWLWLWQRKNRFFFFFFFFDEKRIQERGVGYLYVSACIHACTPNWGPMVGKMDVMDGLLWCLPLSPPLLCLFLVFFLLSLLTPLGSRIRRNHGKRGEGKGDPEKKKGKK